MRQEGWALHLKRGVDVFVGSTLLAATAPLMLGVAAAIRVSMGAPVLFRQVRPGLKAKPFTIYKFRTMKPAGATMKNTAYDGVRLTPLGAFLRKTSLDELPQLWNVVRGDISLVGPRPLLSHYLPLYSPAQARRHDVLPGITGWAQIHGRNAVDWAERFQLDTWYVDNWTPWLDLSILWATAGVALRGRGVSREGHATMPEFTGNDRSMGDFKRA